MNVFMLAVTSIVMSVAAQFSLKAGMTEIKAAAPSAEPLGLQVLLPFLTNKFLLLGFLLYGLGAMVWLGVLAKWDVSKAYPIVGLGFLLSVAVGFALGENVTLFRTFGVLLVVAGVSIVAAS
jgi:multidrug transporter EmrE-like cation transporter